MKKKIDTIQFVPPELEALVSAVLVQGGFPSPEKANESMRRKAEEAARRALSSISPKSITASHPFTGAEKGILRASSVELMSAKLSHLIRQYENPELICVFLGTIGPGFDEEMEQLSEGSMLESLFLDAAGSVLIEHYIDIIEEDVRRRFAEEGLQASLRFSPGYCDWETGEGQKALFSLIDAGAIGVTIKESGMMLPVKTVSGVILGARNVSHRTPCTYCAKKDCPYRREPFLGREA